MDKQSIFEINGHHFYQSKNNRENCKFFISKDGIPFFTHDEYNEPTHFPYKATTEMLESKKCDDQKHTHTCFEKYIVKIFMKIKMSIYL